MRIVIAVPHFPPHYTGGAELRAYRTASRLQNRGHEVRLICIEAIDTSNGTGLTFNDDAYDSLPIRRLHFNLSSAPDPFLWRYDNRWIGQHLQRYLANLAPDVFHLISGYLISGSALNAAIGLNIPTVVTLTDFWFLCPRINLLRSNGKLCKPPFDAVTCARCLGEERRRYRIPGRIAPTLMNKFWSWRRNRVAQLEERMSFLREMLDQTDAIISPSQFVRNLFVKAGISENQIMFSRQGRDFPHLNPESLIKPPAEQLRIGYLGQITPGKGVHHLFEAVQKMPNAALTVKAYGDATRFPNYAHRLYRIAQDDERLTLAGVYKRTEISQVLRGLDVIVVPSVWYENSPNVILEAFAHLTPVVASDLGGMAELVQGEKNGLLFTPGDADDLARQLRRLIEDPHLITTLRDGIPPVKSVAEEIDELEEIYQTAR